MSEELIYVYRGSIVENIHRGDIVVVDHTGNILKKVGDTRKVSYFRSAAKPFLALNVILSGTADFYGFNDKELALMCASHRGETYHIDVLASIVDKIGIKIESLHCGITEPFSRSSAINLYKSGELLSPLYCNCSGKHLGMISVCRYKGYPIEGYYTIAHQVQQDGLEILSRFTDVPKDDIITGVDGCTVPVHGIPLYNMALAYARFADPSALGSEYISSVSRLSNAIVSNPEMLSGKNAFCTDLITVGRKGIIGKVGADGIYCISIPKEGIGIALKIEDGDMRSCHIAAANVLKQLNLLDKEQCDSLNRYIAIPVFDNYKNKIGENKAVFKL